MVEFAPVGIRRVFPAVIWLSVCVCPSGFASAAERVLRVRVWLVAAARGGMRRVLPAVIWLSVCVCPSGFASAAESDDCGVQPSQKTELACTAIIGDAARPDADHARAYVNRARVYLNDQKLDLALPDLDTALRLDNRSVPALLLRGFVFQRKNSFDAAW